MLGPREGALQALAARIGTKFFEISRKAERENRARHIA
jgi:hypothetical protein